MDKLQVVETFFRLIDRPVPTVTDLRILYGSWNYGFFENRIRTFCFKFFNNSVGVGARIAARHRGAGQLINDRCTFCVKSGTPLPAREDFRHIFFDCPSINRVVLQITEELFPRTDDVNVKRQMYMAGIVQNASATESLLYKLTSIILNFNMWECKLRKKIPGIATVRNDLFYMLNNILVNNGKLFTLAINCNIPVCRLWRAGEHGRS